MVRLAWCGLALAALLSPVTHAIKFELEAARNPEPSKSTDSFHSILTATKC